jgi:hypothetical protein
MILFHWIILNMGRCIHKFRKRNQIPSGCDSRGRTPLKRYTLLFKLSFLIDLIQ